MTTIDTRMLPEHFAGFIQRELEYWHVPGFACAVVKNGSVVFLQGYGFRNVAGRQPFTCRTVSGIGSISKSMTAFVLAQLADEGRVDFDRPVHEYLNDFEMFDPVATQETTLRDILSHRTGLGGHDGTWPDNDISRTEYMHRIKYLKPDKPFRSTAQYSNVMYTVAGAIAERIAGTSWESLLQERIFGPLGMRHTYCDMADAEADRDHATPYEVRNSLPNALELWNIDMAGPCGSVMSCAEDMSRWIAMQLAGGVYEGKRLVSSKNYLEMHTPVSLMEFPDTVPYAVRLGYGMAWRITQYFGHIIQHHAGKIGGFSAYQFFCPEAEAGAVFLMNMHEPSNELFFTLMYTLLDFYLGLKPVDWPSKLHTGSVPDERGYTKDNHDYMPIHSVPGTSMSHALEAYTGTFWNDGYGTIRIYSEDSKLFMDMRNVRRLPLTHFHYDVFRADGIKEDTMTITAPVSFMTDTDTGTISSFLIRLEPMVDDILYLRRKEMNRNSFQK